MIALLLLVGTAASVVFFAAHFNKHAPSTDSALASAASTPSLDARAGPAASLRLSLAAVSLATAAPAAATATTNATGTANATATFNTTATDSPLVSLPSDPDATPLTQALYTMLHALSFNTSSVVMGHEHDNYQGQHFDDEEGFALQSDVWQATGKYPLLNGFNLQNVIDGDDYTAHIKMTHLMGGFVQLMWDAYNPTNGGGTHNCTGNPIVELLPNGTGNAQWTAWLDKIGVFVGGLTTPTGELIPVVLRLFHENTGDWYWWGTRCATAHEYKKAWHYTVQYLRETCGAHNLILIYCPSDPATTFDVAFSGRWPGDNWVDVVGFDKYTSWDSYQSAVGADCVAAASVAVEKQLPFAIGETGVSSGLYKSVSRSFFNDVMLDTLARNCSQAAFAHTWVNYNPTKYWVPLPGQPTSGGFKRMAKSGAVLLRGDKRYQTIATSVGFTTDEALNTKLEPGFWDLHKLPEGF